MKKLFYVPVLLSLFYSFFFLAAEIEEVTITWNALKCLSSCVSDIKKNLERTQGVINPEVDPSGFAKMKWDPKVAFSYEPFRYASAAVGIRIRTMRVRVRGKIIKEGSDLYLVSEKDNTRFFLIGPLKIEQGGYSPSNISSHPLTREIKDKLFDAMRRRAILIIEGPLLLPSHYSKALIVEHIGRDHYD